VRAGLLDRGALLLELLALLGLDHREVGLALRAGREREREDRDEQPCRDHAVLRESGGSRRSVLTTPVGCRAPDGSVAFYGDLPGVLRSDRVVEGAHPRRV